MSSLKAKKRKTLETRKKTKKRLKKLGLDHTYSVGWNKHVTVYPGERVSGVFASNVDFADDDVASATRIHNNSNSTSSSGDTETGAAAALACLPPIPQHINMFATVDDAVRAVSVFYKELRRQDGRQKKKLIVLVSSRVVFIKLIKAFDIHFYRNKIMAKKGANSGKTSEGRYKDAGYLEEKMSDKETTRMVNEFKGGKISTLFVMPKQASSLLCMKEKTHVVAQVTKCPVADEYNMRMQLLAHAPPKKKKRRKHNQHPGGDSSKSNRDNNSSDTQDNKNSNTHTRTHPDTHVDTDSNTNSNSNTNANTNTNTNADADAGTNASTGVSIDSKDACWSEQGKAYHSFFFGHNEDNAKDHVAEVIRIAQASRPALVDAPLDETVSEKKETGREKEEEEEK